MKKITLPPRLYFVSHPSRGLKNIIVLNFYDKQCNIFAHMSVRAWGVGRVLMSAQNVVFLDGSIKGARKKNAFFADASAKTFTPRERRNEKMDDFERKKKTSGLKENFNILRTDTLAKSSFNIFAYSFVSEHSKHFFLTCFLSVH